MTNELTFISYTLATMASLLFVTGLAVLSSGGEMRGVRRKYIDDNRLHFKH